MPQCANDDSNTGVVRIACRGEPRVAVYWGDALRRCVAAPRGGAHAERPEAAEDSGDGPNGAPEYARVDIVMN